MTAAHDHADDDHAADAHDHHDEPAPPPEPETPLWFTLLGIGLFVFAGLAFLLYRGDRPMAPSPEPPPMPTMAAPVHAQAPAPQPAGSHGTVSPQLAAAAALSNRLVRPQAPTPPPMPSGMHRGRGPE
jgi:hypothetical protein